MNTVSWQSPTTPLPVENNPSVVFERLFGEGGTPEERLDRMKKKRSLLDRVNQDLARLQRSLGPGDRARIAEYLDAVREVERRIQTAEEQNATSTLAGAGPSRRHSGAVRRSSEAAVRPAVARVSGRPHPRLQLDVRARAEQPQLSGDRNLRAAPRAVASRRQAGADREILAAEHVSGRVVRLLPGKAAVDARWRRQSARLTPSCCMAAR